MDSKKFEQFDSPVSKLEKVYSQTQGWEEVLSAVRKGDKEFCAEVEKRGLTKNGTETSKVHTHADVEPQGFAIAITSRGNYQEMKDKSFLVSGAHWIDDFIDNPRLVTDPDSMYENRHDIQAVLKGMGQIGEVGFLFADKVKNREAVLKGLHRVVYGGLIGRETEREKRDKLLKEYFFVSNEGLNHNIVNDIKTIQPQAYITTSKVVLEFVNAPESDFNMDVSEIWNLIYGPALYYHDNKEEELNGELHFSQEEKPRSEELLKMINIGTKYLLVIPDPRFELRLKQLKFILGSFGKVLPQKFIEKYQKILELQLNGNIRQPLKP